MRVAAAFSSVQEAAADEQRAGGGVQMSSNVKVAAADVRAA